VTIQIFIAQTSFVHNQNVLVTLDRSKFCCW